ncbi:hypothetical protein [Tsukamurella paurometabola]
MPGDLGVNVASKCGLTPQYAGLEKPRYAERGLAVLGVPSSQFLGQEPGSAGDRQGLPRRRTG